MLDRLTGMAAFVKAAELGSFTAAGAVLGMSSQMVGKHVTALEQRLGAPLLTRTTRRQSLTDVGQLFYERCRTVLAEAEAAETLVEGMSTTPRGRLRVNAPVSFGACRLAPVVMDFLGRHPEVELQLTLTDRYVDMVDEGYDAVFRLGPIGDTGLVARELVRNDQIACAAPGYLARNGTPQTPGDLAHHTCLGFVNWSGLPYAEWRFTRDGIPYPVQIRGRFQVNGGRDQHAPVIDLEAAANLHWVRDGIPYPVQIRGRFQVNDGRVLVSAAIAGHGIILQPEAVVRDAIDAGALVEILPDYTPPSRPLYLMFAPRHPQPPKLRVFIDHVMAALGAAQ